MREKMEALIRELGIVERVHLCGVVAPSFDGLAPCDLILLTSRAEGTSNVLLEAQWLGVPIIATDAGGTVEAVNGGVTGLVVASDEVADVADAVLRILKDDGFRATARVQGPAFIGAKYGMERMIAETLAAYRLGKHAGAAHSVTSLCSPGT